MTAPRKHRVLVTGANGALGRSIAHELYRDQAGTEFVLALGLEEQPYYFREYHPDRFGYRVVNLTKPRQLKELFLSESFKKARIDTVVHLGFLSTTRTNASAEPFDLAVEGTRQFLAQ